MKAEVDVAEILGVPGMRHDATRGYAADYTGPKSFDVAVSRLAEGAAR